MVAFNGITLCDNETDLVDGHRGLRISGNDILQVEPVIRSVYPFVRGRGNRMKTVEFTAMKRHASVSDAVTYCGSHEDSLRGTASFTGFGVSLNNAVCNVSISHVGVTTIAQYTITGSKTPEDII